MKDSDEALIDMLVDLEGYERRCSSRQEAGDHITFQNPTLLRDIIWGTRDSENPHMTLITDTETFVLGFKPPCCSWIEGLMGLDAWREAAKGSVWRSVVHDYDKITLKSPDGERLSTYFNISEGCTSSSEVRVYLAATHKSYPLLTAYTDERSLLAMHSKIEWALVDSEDARSDLICSSDAILSLWRDLHKV